MEDNKNEKNLPQQGFGAPVAGVEGVIVPGAPTSSSSEGLTGVLPTGTLAELATVEERRVLVKPNAPEEDLWVEHAERMKEGLKREINANLEKAMEGMDPPSADVDPRDGDWEPLFENLAGNLYGATEDMEVTEEVSTKKKKAVISPVIISSGDDEDNVDAPCESRKCKATRTPPRRAILRMSKEKIRG
ncbi:mads-domain transcription [Lasius niger]|uniref:Mads-domain transcription n=1 Tax=Lasius niger TaxID=67767 RepID=A0A0J7KTE5_LASNI|nr:mads-domain transcription [Lasius niger]